MTKKVKIRNPRWVHHLECDIQIDDGDWLPFTASPNDSEEHGREAYKKILKGDYGKISNEKVPTS